jgi:hypothetical protein
MGSRGDDVAVSDRLARLEQRVRRLEDRRDQSRAHESAGHRPPPGDHERFWALDMLKELVEEPGAVLFTGTVTTPGGGHVEWQQGHSTGELADADWNESVDRLRALAHPVRLLLLREVLNGTHTAAELANNTQLGTTGQLYHHLRQLIATGWLRAGGHGRYHIPAERVVPLLVTLAATRR